MKKLSPSWQASVRLSDLLGSHPELAVPQFLASAGRVAVRKAAPATVGCERDPSRAPWWDRLLPAPRALTR